MSDTVKAAALFLSLSTASSTEDFIKLLGDVLDTSPDDIALLSEEQVGIIEGLFGAEDDVVDFLIERGIISGDQDEEFDPERDSEENEEVDTIGNGGPLFDQLLGASSAADLVDKILAAGAEVVASQLSAQEIDLIIGPFAGDTYFLGFLESNGVSSLDQQGPIARERALAIVDTDPNLTLTDEGKVVNGLSELMVFTPAGVFAKAPAASLRVLGQAVDSPDEPLPPFAMDEDEEAPIFDDPLDDLKPGDPRPGDTPLEEGTEEPTDDDDTVLGDEEIPDDPGSEKITPDEPIGDGDLPSDSSSLILVGIPPEAVI